MNVAAATSTVSRPFAFMTPRGSDAVETGAGTRTPTSTAPADPQPEAGGTDPLVNRFPTIAFSYDTDASRLVMLYRDPANGKTVSQIPTEAALKQYKEAQQKEKNAERASLLGLTVGGNGQGNGQASGQAGSQSAAYGRGGSGVSPVAGTGLSTGTGTSTSAVSPSTAAPVALAASATSSSVAQSPSTSIASAGSSAARVNVVI
ncbi:hypothetical protein SAMN02982917_1357 [Azospirillum oryzae]|uniref:Uncharacterized protein n=1 Tax=Azospirillum oryzae TaxID=286727 RepID=A0A1X7E908_9PROT|nr:hypothetical protein [Azospirillum oryzae]SMF29423.1 hypothetical protein SAMN02982917_1357 [Azospirillum oryzae]